MRQTTRKRSPRAKQSAFPAKLVGKADLASLAGLSRARISQLSATGGPLAGAVQDDGSIDLAHPSVVTWATARGTRLDIKAPEATRDQELESGFEIATPEEPVSDFAALSRRKKLADTVAVETRNETIAGRLISKELAQKFGFSHLEALHLQLLGDDYRRHRAKHGAEAGDDYRAAITTGLKRAKRGLLAGLAAARIQGDPPPVTEKPTEPDREYNRGVYAVASAVAARLETEAATAIVDAVAKALARNAAGEQFHREIFDQVMAAVQPAAEDAARAAAAIMRAHVAAAVRAATFEEGPTATPETHK